MLCSAAWLGLVRCQIHRNLITSSTVISPWDGRSKKIHKTLNCKNQNLVYYLKCTHCPMGPNLTPHYVGSSVNFRGSRWSKHKNSMLKGDGSDCHFCEHWAVYHKNDLQDLSNLLFGFLWGSRTCWRRLSSSEEVRGEVDDQHGIIGILGSQPRLQ